MQKILPILATLLLLLLLSACKPTTTPPTTAPSTTTTAPARTPRIVSTVPAATLILVQIGAEESLVGVTKYDQLFLPPAYQDLPVVGDYTSLNYETLIRLNPTALLTQTAQHRIEPRLRTLSSSQNFQILNLKLDSISDLWTTAKTLGIASNHENSALRKIAAAQAQLDEIQSQNKNRPKPRTLYIVGDNPTTIVGDKSFHNEFITLAGGENLGTKVGDYWPVIGNETLLKLNPEVLLIGLPGQPPQTQNDPRLAPYLKLPIPAAKNNRIYLLTHPNSQMLTLDIADQITDLQKLLHPKTP